MRSDEAARPQGPRASHRTPDQLQQARRPDAPAPRAAVEAPRPASSGGGVLGQLRTERAHD